jgi:hypothetical protein
MDARLKCTTAALQLAQNSFFCAKIVRALLVLLPITVPSGVVPAHFKMIERRSIWNCADGSVGGGGAVPHVDVDSHRVDSARCAGWGDDPDRPLDVEMAAR